MACIAQQQSTLTLKTVYARCPETGVFAEKRIVHGMSADPCHVHGNVTDAGRRVSRPSHITGITLTLSEVGWLYVYQHTFSPSSFTFARRVALVVADFSPGEQQFHRSN